MLLRVDFNVPMEDGVILDDRRISAALPTLTYLHEHGARTIIVTHFGRPKGAPNPDLSTRPIAVRTAELLHLPVLWVADIIGNEAQSLRSVLQDGQFAMLENVRFDSREEANDPAFAKGLAALADVFCNDAFGAAHRTHASTAGVAAYLPSCAGLLLAQEIRVLTSLMTAPEHPFVALLGGAKVSSKIAVLESLLQHVDSMWVGGAMACTFLKAEGHHVGTSLVEDDQIGKCASILEYARSHNVKLHLPLDVVVAPSLTDGADARTVDITAIPDDCGVFDVGPKTVDAMKEDLAVCRTLIWNGPFGAYEHAPFEKGTHRIGEACMSCHGTTVLGGGDAAAALEGEPSITHFTHVSTGGGATLEFLEGRTLPGIAALETAPSEVVR
ncbi:MAG: phosphoglycerate kinase [Candidatus Dormibacteria bacterium]